MMENTCRSASEGTAFSRNSPCWMSVVAVSLIGLFLQASCAHLVPQSEAEGVRSSGPAPGQKVESSRPPVSVDVALLEPHGTTRVVAVKKEEFQAAVRRLVGPLRSGETPQDAARRLLQTPPEEELLAEVFRGRVLGLVPLNDKGLVSKADAALRDGYLSWCEGRGGTDCLGLLTDGVYLRADDRRTLALALAFGSVLDETREALGRELSPRAVIASLAWTAGLYLALWLVPEPSTKAVAAALSVLLVAWLGVDAVWGLLDGWVRVVYRAYEATTFAELREAGEDFGRTIGTDAARALILAVATLSGRTLGDVAEKVRSLPGYDLAQEQWAAEGGQMSMTESVTQVVAVEPEAALPAHALAVLISPQTALAGAMLSQSHEAGAPQGRSATVVMTHRGGNKQVILANGQRWHLPRGKWLGDIPAEDKLGDELQAAAERIAREWGPQQLSDSERAVIQRALDANNPRSAAHLEGLARGRWVHRRLKDEFPHLEWNVRGVDVLDPAPGGQRYEVLSGTPENFGVHGRRMATELYRMIFF